MWAFLGLTHGQKAATREPTKGRTQWSPTPLARDGAGFGTEAQENPTSSRKATTTDASRQPWQQPSSGGGVLEHPADSHAWAAFGIPKPPRNGGWAAVLPGVWTCCVFQGHYGHKSGKPTWLIAARIQKPPELIWGKTEQRLPQWMIDRYGYEKARRIGVVAMVGGKHKTAIRNATPKPFRDLLIAIARSAAAHHSIVAGDQ